MNIVEIREEPIELYKLLKLADMAGSGGEAKMLIEDERVLVNGVVETRKRKKIVAGDVIQLDEEKLEVRLGKQH